MIGLAWAQKRAHTTLLCNLTIPSSLNSAPSIAAFGGNSPEGSGRDAARFRRARRALPKTPAKSEKRRIRRNEGVVSFGYFSLDKQRKVSRLPVREPALKKTVAKRHNLTKIQNNRMCLAIPTQITEINPTTQMATVTLDGVKVEVSLALVDDVEVGDYVLVHVGYALNKIDEDEALKTLALFAEAGLGQTL